MENRLTTKYLAAWICVVIFFGALVFSREPENSSNSICLSGGNLLDISKGNIILNALVIIEGETIQYAGPNKPFEQSEDNTLIDCSGKTLLPGLFDAHIHLGGTSTLDYILIGEERKLSGFLCSGVTSVFDLGGVQDWIFGLREAEKRNKRLSPRIFAVGPLFTSPGGHGTEYGVPMALTPTTEQEAREAVRKLAPEKPEMIKIIYEKGAKHFTSLSFRLMETIIDEAHQNDFTVITHTLTLEQAKDAVKAGTDGLAHIFGDKEIDEELLRDMKQNTVFCIPTLAIFEALSTDLLSTHEYLKWPLVKDAVCQEILVNLKKQREIPWLKEYSEVRKMLLQKGKINIKKMFDHGIRLVLGTDAGNPAVFFGPSVHREM